MTPQERLMVDLARLIHRHGPETFEGLLSLLRQPEQTERLAETLERALTVPFPAPSASRSRQRAIPGVQVLREVMDRSPEKFEVLSDIRDKLSKGEIFRSTGDLRRFAEENGISLGSANTRLKAIVPILQFLATLPLESIGELMRPYEDSDDRSLARWSEVIMGGATPVISEPEESPDSNTLERDE